MTTGPGEHPTPDEVGLLLDGEGDPGLRRHVDGCTHCQDVLDRQRTVRELLSTQAAQPPLPREVSESWLRALAEQPPFGASRPGREGPSDGIARPPDFDVWPADVTDLPADVARPPALERPAAGYPDDPRVVGPRAGGVRRPMDQRRLRRLRMAVALAAGLTVLVGAGAATWTVYIRQGPTSSADAALPSPIAGSEERVAGDEPSGPGQAAPEAPAGSAPSPGSAGTSASTGTTATVATLPEDQVRAAVAGDDLRWVGAGTEDEARSLAEDCLRGMGTDEPVLAALPAVREGEPIQVIVSADQGRWRVTEVTPGCPPDGSVVTTHLTP